MKAGAELDQRGNPPANNELAGARFGDAGHQFEQCALARPVAANHAQRAAGGNFDGHVTDSGERFFGLQIANQAAREQGTLEGRKLAAVAEFAVDL